ECLPAFARGGITGPDARRDRSRGAICVAPSRSSRLEAVLRALARASQRLDVVEGSPPGRQNSDGLGAGFSYRLPRQCITIAPSERVPLQASFSSVPGAGVEPARALRP